MAQETAVPTVKGLLDKITRYGDLRVRAADPETRFAPVGRADENRMVQHFLGIRDELEILVCDLDALQVHVIDGKLQGDPS